MNMDVAVISHVYVMGHLLCLPSIQASWTSLRAEFSALNPAQLHHILREYSSNKVYPSGWTPSPADAEDAVRTGESVRFHSRVQSS